MSLETSLGDRGKPRGVPGYQMLPAMLATSAIWSPRIGLDIFA